MRRFIDRKRLLSVALLATLAIGLAQLPGASHGGNMIPAFVDCESLEAPHGDCTFHGGLTLLQGLSAPAVSVDGGLFVNFQEQLSGWAIEGGNADVATLRFDADRARFWSPEGDEVFTVTSDGRIGVGTAEPKATLHVNGDFFTTGKKAFVAPNPQAADESIVYVALEGPEVGTYIRGTTRLENGRAEIDLPAHFAAITNDEGLTVQLTPMGQWLQLYVAEQSAQRLVIEEANGKSGRFHYFVQGVRTGYEGHQVIERIESGD